MLALLIASAPAWAGKIEHHTWQGTTTCTDVESGQACSGVATVTLKIKGRRDAMAMLTFRGKYRCSGACIRPAGKISGFSVESLEPVEQEDGTVIDELAANLEATVTFKGGKSCFIGGDSDGDAPVGGITGVYSCFVGSPEPYESGDVFLIRVK